MMGGATDKAGLTAFVSGALSLADEATGKSTFRDATSKAAAFLKKEAEAGLATNVYTQILILRARALAGSLSSEDAAKDVLKLRQQDHWAAASVSPDSDSDSHQPWRHRPATLDVEATAYAIRLLIGADLVGETISSVRWLVSKQNGQGGFVSTQDTVVALESLSAVAQKLSSNQKGVSCKVSREHGSGKLALGEVTVEASNFDVLQMIDVASPELLGDVILDCSGEGMAIASVLARWNTDFDEEPAVFEVAQQWTQIGQRMNVSVCTLLQGEGEGEGDQKLLDGYHLLRVGLFSGYIADAASLAGGPPGLVQRTEPGDGCFDIYLDRLPIEGVCMFFVAEQVHEVKELQSVRSEVFDYYTPSRRGGSMLTYSEATDLVRSMPEVVPAPSPASSSNPDLPLPARPSATPAPSPNSDLPSPARSNTTSAAVSERVSAVRIVTPWTLVLLVSLLVSAQN